MTWTTYSDYQEYMKRRDDFPDDPINPALNQIVEDIPTGSSVLDVGCGNGRLMLALEKKGCVARGIDLSPAKLVQARAKGLNVLEGNVDEPSPEIQRWLTACYDAATFCKSLGYIQHRHRLFSSLNAGVIYVHKNNPPPLSWSQRLARWRERFGFAQAMTSELSGSWLDAKRSVVNITSTRALRQWGETFGFRSEVIYVFQRQIVVKFWRA